MISVNIPPPNDRQKLFLSDTHKYIAFGGARGGGKSWAVRVKALILAARYDGIKIMIVRRTYPELRANHITPFKAYINGIARYNEATKELRFINGSVILFRYAANEKDLDKYQGTEVDVLFLDEATQFTEEQFDRFKACVRGVNGFPKRIYLTCNPGGVGHSWVKRLFVDKKYLPGEKPEEYAFFRSLVTDNKALMESDPEYILKLQSLPPKLRKAWLEGDWDIFDGQFFEEFRIEPLQSDLDEAGISREEAKRQHRYCHVIPAFDVPREWKVYRSFDFGFAKPFACDWWAVDYDGRAYLIYQFYGCTGVPNEGLKWHPDKIFAEIHRIESTHPYLRGRDIYGVADPSIWDASRGEAVVESAFRHYVYFDKGDNKRLPGWMQCHYRLAFDDDGYSMVYFFDNCTAAIRTLPLLQFSPTNPEDLDTTQEDHFADSFRYFCMSRPIKSVITKIMKQTPADDPLGLYDDRRHR